MEGYEIELSKLLLKRRLTLSVAESLTGGLLSKVITDVSGSSEYYLGGIVVYSVFAKEQIVKVPVQIVDNFGTVSAEVAYELARRVRAIFMSDLAISTTGIAGPAAVEGKPVGLVYVGVATKEKTFTFEEHLAGSREQIRLKTVEIALNKTIDILNNGGKL
ncbi:MAG: CinA family protein [Caldisericaceae bacterium]